MQRTADIFQVGSASSGGADHKKVAIVNAPSKRKSAKNALYTGGAMPLGPEGRHRANVGKTGCQKLQKEQRNRT